ncbi:STAS domain-containing protein [Mycolicibacterium parafortuitum]|uniref:Anti-sigma factor antagonist n=1 Tax=Mycolicibacterium parafortuitum TaxID=39692 RepID=A0A375YD22_MYCPF|nr:STAS domain-containing protein [Mycolicibacterium parafortuitum]ORB30995.1 anti-anti-sigma factor [Mycolicibacterium parafortuitum]SRX79005.1 anti-sigma-factor antagonist [Actinosynnema mirum DSM] [Mycolicibacterium parafortuitum]
MKLTLAVHNTAHSTRIRVSGDLDYGTTSLLVDTVGELLTERSGLQDLHLDFTELAFCDSAGLSGLVMIHRRTSAAGLRLHLDERPAQLERVLTITGLLDFFTAAALTADDESDIG